MITFLESSILNITSVGLQTVVFGAAVFALGWYVGGGWRNLRVGDDDTVVAGKGKPNLPLELLAEEFGDFKMVLVVRNDLKMGKGKVAAQCGHATLGLYKKLLGRAPSALLRWEESAQVKVVTKVESEEEMFAMQEKANALDVATHIAIDAGRTQIAPNSRTVLALLGPDHLVNRVSGHLKLL